MSIPDNLRAQAEKWASEDPDPITKAEIQKLLETGDREALEDRFQGMLQFGTAGLRGLLGAGPHRMNRSVVLRATAGLAAYVLREVEGAKERGIAIGFDGRRMSREFAKDAAEVIAGFGIQPLIFEDVVPTPLLGYAVVQSNAAAGIMVTASHNPPNYNGYKVYWENGAQIIPPHDAGIAAEIAAIEAIADIPRAEGKAVPFPASYRVNYLAAVKKLALHPDTPRDLRVVYSAMHGVGGALVMDALADAGFAEVHPVVEQHEPDGEFPTVEFPNPEEDGAMDLALALAKEKDAELIIANDPDADRLACIVRHNGTYRPLSGNEIGSLFAHYLLDQGEGEKRLVLASVVSSPMLLSIGEAHQARAELTLTGHKWIHNRAMELEPDGFRFVFGFEEALGYAISPLVRDKDGVSAAAVMCDMAAWCKTQGRTLVDELELAWRRYGMFLSEQISVVLPGAEGAAQIQGIMKRARTDAPTSLGGLTVTAIQDFETGLRRDTEGAEEALTFPQSNVVLFELEGGHRAMLRPSGTEPKIKFYFDVRVDIAEGESIEDAQSRGRTLLENVTGDFRARFDPR
ncbi:MAG: phospho-sugar mutase [Myxococcota bacterium]